MKLKLKLLLLLFMIISLPESVFSEQDTYKKHLRVAVFNFEAKGEGISEALAEAVTENLITNLIDSKVFNVIERNQLNKIMNELNLQNNDDFRQKLGELYGVELAIFGSVTKIGDNITINARGVEIETGVGKFAKQVWTDSVNDIPSLISLLVDYIVEAIQKNYPDKADNNIQENHNSNEKTINTYNTNDFHSNTIKSGTKILIAEYNVSKSWEKQTFWTDDIKELTDNHFSQIIFEADYNCIEFEKVRIAVDDEEPNVKVKGYFILDPDIGKNFRVFDTLDLNNNPRQILRIRVKCKTNKCKGRQNAILKIYGIR